MTKRYDKIAIGLSFITLLISAGGVIVNYLQTKQAMDSSNQALSIASSAYSIANNYGPIVEVSSTSLILQPVLCGPVGSGNVSCRFTGTFNVSFRIIAPHVGTYNITFLGLNGLGPFSRQTAFYMNANGPSARVGDMTIVAYPPFEYLWNGVGSLPHGGVPVSSNQPFGRTEEISAIGFTLIAPLSSMESRNFSGQAQLSFLLTFWDQQELGIESQNPFTVHVFFWF
jgi:hypothetical protein